MLYLMSDVEIYLIDYLVIIFRSDVSSTQCRLWKDSIGVPWFHELRDPISVTNRV